MTGRLRDSVALVTGSGMVRLPPSSPHKEERT